MIIFIELTYGRSGASVRFNVADISRYFCRFEDNPGKGSFIRLRSDPTASITVKETPDEIDGLLLDQEGVALIMNDDEGAVE